MRFQVGEGKRAADPNPTPLTTSHLLDVDGLHFLRSLRHRRQSRGDVRQYVLDAIGNEIFDRKSGPDELRLFHVIEQRAQRIPEAFDVGDQDRFLVLSELCPGHLFDEFFERADAARQSHEGVGVVEHQLLALVHVVRHHDLAARHGVLAVDQELRNDADRFAAVVEDGARQFAHQADRSAAVHQTDLVLGQDFSERAGGLDEGRIGAGAGAAIDTDFSDVAHAGYIETLAGNLKAADVLGGEIPYIRGPDGPRTAYRVPPGAGHSMSDTHLRSPHAPKREISADGGKLILTLHRLWPYIWPSDRSDLKRRVVYATLLLLAAKLATISVPFTFKWAVDALAGQGTAPVAADSWLAWAIAAPIAMTLAYGGMRILMAGFTQLRDGVFAKVAMHAVRKLAAITFEHMHQLSLRFHLERKTGGLTRVLERGRNGIETIVRMVILQAAPTIVEVALIAGVLLYQFDWRYVAVILVTVSVYMWFTYAATEWRIAIRRRMNESDTDANTKAIDSLLNYETVKYFTAEERETRRYDRSMERYENASVKSYTSLAALNAGQALIFTLGLAAVMVMCALDVKSGRNTVGDFVMINAMMIQLYQPLNFMGMVYREIKQATVDIEIMFSILNRPAEIVDRPDAKPLRISNGSVRFENVAFAYDAKRPILKGVSFEVPAGKTIAIVGPSGAGKSTISRLLFRFYDVTGGRISIDGQDVRDVTQASLRAAIGMVPQDTVLFNDTVRYNIRYGRWEASDDEVEEAARLAQIDTFIRNSPYGYETEVGERGLKLSGGEKQRVAIARTILKAPPILVLDEATSALDSHTEREIQDALERVSRNRTTLVIAHRLSTIVGADEIIVLDKGVIAERGNHFELLACGGLYASMWNRQREAAEAREKLAQVEDEPAAPNRNPPPVADPALDAQPSAAGRRIDVAPASVK